MLRRYYWYETISRGLFERYQYRQSIRNHVLRGDNSVGLVGRGVTTFERRCFAESIRDDASCRGVTVSLYLGRLGEKEKKKRMRWKRETKTGTCQLGMVTNGKLKKKRKGAGAGLILSDGVNRVCRRGLASVAAWPYRERKKREKAKNGTLDARAHSFFSEWCRSCSSLRNNRLLLPLPFAFCFFVFLKSPLSPKVLVLKTYLWISLFFIVLFVFLFLFFTATLFPRVCVHVMISSLESLFGFRARWLGGMRGSSVGFFQA